MRAVLAVTVVLLVAACGGSPTTQGTGSTQVKASLAFAGCMRAHGVTNFPDPGPQGDFPTFETGVSKQVSNAANDTCKHLLSSGETPATPQQRAQKLEFGVKVAECLRAHGYPQMPDPTHLGSQSLPAGIDPNAPQFQAAENACEKQAGEELGIR
jgi:hypothetical protein